MEVYEVNRHSHFYQPRGAHGPPQGGARPSGYAEIQDNLETMQKPSRGEGNRDL